LKRKILRFFTKFIVSPTEDEMEKNRQIAQIHKSWNEKFENHTKYKLTN
jgi:hypothetical protein